MSSSLRVSDKPNSSTSSNKIVKNYTPNASELNTKIEAILKEEPNKEWKDVCEQLKTENPTWVLPDRRVSKFVKRVKSGSKGNDDDKSVSTKRSMGSRLFSGRKNKKNSKAKVATEQEQQAAAADKQEEESLQPAATVDTDMSAATPEQAPDMTSKVIETTYHDDNDGKKFGCWCLGA